MAEFTYRGRGSDGQLVEGTLQGASRAAVLKQLKQQNIIATKIEEGAAKKTAAGF